jgi:hypothetical protein
LSGGASSSFPSYRSLGLPAFRQLQNRQIVIEGDDAKARVDKIPTRLCPTGYFSSIVLFLSVEAQGQVGVLVLNLLKSLFSFTCALFNPPPILKSVHIFLQRMFCEEDKVSGAFVFFAFL